MGARYRIYGNAPILQQAFNINKTRSPVATVEEIMISEGVVLKTKRRPLKQDLPGGEGRNRTESPIQIEGK